MALITYDDKSNSLPITNVRRIYRDIDANEVKNVVNTNAGLLQTKEFNRAFSETLVFDKNIIFDAPYVMVDDLNLTVSPIGLVNQESEMRVRITFDGIHSINFGPGFDFLYGITNGQIVDAGTFEVYFLYVNGSVVVNLPGVSAQSSGATVLATPSNFMGTPDGETDIDLVWDDVSNESSYLVEFSLTGTGGWSTLSTPAADATTSNQTGLSAGNIRYYRMKAIGDGVNYLDSAYTSVISVQTESSGDVTDPVPTFLPANGNAVWPINKPLRITWDEPVRNADGSDITNGNVATRIRVKQTNVGGADISITATVDGTKQIFDILPLTHFGINQLVYWDVNNVEDINGNDITSALSALFTTTAFTFFNGTSNRLIFGDILDSIFAANDTNFWLETTINEQSFSGTRVLVSKSDATGNQRGFSWYYAGADVFFTWFSQGSSIGSVRSVKWTNVLTAGEHDLILKYDGSIDTNSGLDRVILLIDGATAGSKTLDLNSGTLGNINNSTAQLTVGAYINSAGTPLGGYYSGEAKDFVVRSNAGGTVEINVANLVAGTDSSGNSRNGTWV